jgi:hypothetical protein
VKDEKTALEEMLEDRRNDYINIYKNRIIDIKKLMKCLRKDLHDIDIKFKEIETDFNSMYSIVDNIDWMETTALLYKIDNKNRRET